MDDHKATKKKILLLAADVSNNCMGRIWILADMLADRAEVEILGVASGDSIWPPLAGNSSHKVTTARARVSNPFLATLALMRALRGQKADMIYVCKPKFHNMLAALLVRGPAKLALDIDDWEAGFARGNFSKYALINYLARLGISFTQLAELFIPFIRLRTVSNVFLQKRYGGVVIPHARDGAAFTIIHGERQADLRGEFHIPSAGPVLLFLGTPHRHKGIMHMIEAVALSKHPHCHLVIAGLPASKPEYAQYRAAAEGKLAGRYQFLPFIDWQKVPVLLQCADIILVPQTRQAYTQGGQTPAKIFDAMASGRPLIVSDLSDSREITAGHAWLVAPDDPQAIACAMDEILDHPHQAQARGLQARQQFLNGFSYEVVAPLLIRHLGL